jgi:hypothetical protein
MDAVPPAAVFAVLMCWTVTVGAADAVFAAALAVGLASQAPWMRRGQR